MKMSVKALLSYKQFKFEIKRLNLALFSLKSRLSLNLHFYIAIFVFVLIFKSTFKKYYMNILSSIRK